MWLPTFGIKLEVLEQMAPQLCMVAQQSTECDALMGISQIQPVNAAWL